MAKLLLKNFYLSMNNLNLIITEQAYNDMDLISDFIARDNVKAAEKHLNLLLKACCRLTKFPESGIKRPDFTYKDYRFYIVKKRYVIAYRVENNNLYISRVLTAYQDICALL